MLADGKEQNCQMVSGELLNGWASWQHNAMGFILEATQVKDLEKEGSSGTRVWICMYIHIYIYIYIYVYTSLSLSLSLSLSYVGFMSNVGCREQRPGLLKR